jgi:hypothetical protein
MRAQCVHAKARHKYRVLFEEMRKGGGVKRWDCWIEVTRNTVVDADDEDQARARALDWFFNECIHAIDERDVVVQPLDGED